MTRRLQFKVDLIHGPIFQSLLFFAIPLFFSNVFQQLYNTVDTMIVGHALGDLSLAAIGSCAAIYDLLIGFALGIGNGLAIVTARSYGANDTELLKKSVAASIVIGLLTSLVLRVGAEVILMPLLKMLDTPPEIIAEAFSYISVITRFTLVMFAYNLCAGLLRAIGNSFMPLVFLVLSSCLNIGLDLFFITQLNMGVGGAAVATVIAQGISVVLCLIYILKKAPVLIPQRRHFKIERGIYAEMLGQGLSMGFMGSIVAAGSVVLQYGINNLGTLVIAGHTAARKLFMFFNMPFSAMAMAISTFVSQNRGADQRTRILKAMRCAVLYDIAMAAGVTVILLLFAPALVQLISGSQEAVVLNNGALYLRVVGPFYAVLGVLLETRYALQGLGAKMIPLVSSVIELLGKIVFAFVFIPRFQYLAVIFCEPVIWCLMTAQLIYAYATHPYIRGKKEKAELSV